MIDKENLLDKVRVSASAKPLAIRTIDLAGQVMRKHEPAFSDFMSPEDQDTAMRILREIPEVQYAFFGGYPDAEYMMLGIFPDWMMFEDDDFPVSAVDVTMKEETEHRAVLGSVLGLGIKREKIGDLIVHGDVIQIVASRSMAEYIALHLRRVGRHPAEACVIEVGSLSPKAPEYEAVTATVKSLRLDSVVASGFNMSRGKAADLIRQERVKVNYRFVTSVSHALKAGDMISVRGKGRLLYDGDDGTTRKDRIRVRLRRVK